MGLDSERARRGVFASRLNSYHEGRSGARQVRLSSEPGRAELADVSQVFETVARVEDVVEGIGVPVTIAGRAVALFLVDGEYFAIDDNCPHQALPLYDGIIVERTVTCLAHGWRFNLADGRNFDNPRLCVATYPVRVVGDEIQVGIAMESKNDG